MGYAEYLFRMNIYRKKQVDKHEEMLLNAWLVSRLAVAQKKDKYVFKTFDEFKKVLVSEDERKPKKANMAELYRVAYLMEEGG